MLERSRRTVAVTHAAVIKPHYRDAALREGPCHHHELAMATHSVLWSADDNQYTNAMARACVVHNRDDVLRGATKYQRAFR
jgi:hypothetical protein